MKAFASWYFKFVNTLLVCGYVFVVVPKMVSAADTRLNIFALISLPLAIFYTYVVLKPGKTIKNGTQTTAEKG